MIYNRIRSFFERLSPELACDACVVDRLGLTEDQMPSTVIHEQTSYSEFEREFGTCVMCDSVTQATRHKRRAA